MECDGVRRVVMGNRIEIGIEVVGHPRSLPREAGRAVAILPPRGLSLSMG
jgi:hypothetical protein